MSAYICCSWNPIWRRVKRFGKPKNTKRQSRIDMEYAVKFSYPQILNNAETGNGEVTTDKSSSAVVCISRYPSMNHPEPDDYQRPSYSPHPTPEASRSFANDSAARDLRYESMPDAAGSEVKEPIVLVHKPDETPPRDEGIRDEHRETEKATYRELVSLDVRRKQEPAAQEQLEPLTQPCSPTASGLEPVPVEDFVTHVKRMKEESSSFDDEWARLYEHRYMAQCHALMEPNFKKNRYKNILPYDHSRVVLDVADGDPYSDYVNASYIQSFNEKRTYIASQGPNVTSLSDFWRMIWQENVETIVMATNLVDRGKIKCEKYWPAPGGELFFEDIVVACENEIHGTHDSRRILIVQKGEDVRFMDHFHFTRWPDKGVSRNGEDVRFVDHFHFTRWPDKGVPRNVSVLIRFIERVNESRDQKTTPLLVHCSAGVGRTGVVIALDNEMERVKETGFVDIFNYIREMRHCRPQMVQTPEQYEFIHDAMLEYLLGHETMISRDQFMNHVTELETRVDSDHPFTRLEQEFEIIQKVCHEPPIDATNVGKMEENTSKNRYQNVLPRDTHRPLLISYSTDTSTQYINATFCQGYKDREKIITTQMPLPHTVTDFLRMVYDYRISTIVMLNDAVDEEAPSLYWDEGNPNIKEPFSVSVLDMIESDHWIERTLELKHRKNTRIIQHFQFLSWKPFEKTNFYRTLLEFMNNVTSQQGGDSPLLVHCLNGVGRTGVFCVVKMSLDQLEVEDAIDVFQTVKALKNDNFQMIQSLEDYHLCYSILNQLIAMSHDDPSHDDLSPEAISEPDDPSSESMRGTDTKDSDELEEDNDGDDDDDDDDQYDEEQEDVEIDPIEYYAHSDADIDDDNEEEFRANSSLMKPFTSDLDINEFDTMSITKL